MRTEYWTPEELRLLKYDVVEVLMGLKQISLLVKFTLENDEIFALFRPESTLKISIDPTIPKPKELYLDCEFSRQCNLVGWNQFAPVIPWSIGEDKGVLRPYWQKSSTIEYFQFRKEKLLKSNAKFWKSVAVADYIFGIGDRVSNDFLNTPDGIKVVDSGFSFVTGLDLPLNLSLIRRLLQNEPIKEDSDLLDSILQIYANIENSSFLTNDEKFWVTRRTENILSKKLII